MLKNVTTVWLVALTVIACRSESSYEHYVHEACELLKVRQDRLRSEYRLDEWERYDWDQDHQELVFSHHGEPKVIAKIQFVGSYSKISNTWRWAWANETVQPGMKIGVTKVKQLGAQNLWARLTEPQWSATEEDCWDMTAVALRVLDADGAYRSPDESGLTFMVITSIRWATGQNGT